MTTKRRGREKAESQEWCLLYVDGQPVTAHATIDAADEYLRRLKEVLRPRKVLKVIQNIECRPAESKRGK